MNNRVRKRNKPASLALPRTRFGRLHGMGEARIHHDSIHAANLVQHTRAWGERVPGMTLGGVRHGLHGVVLRSGRGLLGGGELSHRRN